MRKLPVRGDAADGELPCAREVLARGIATDDRGRLGPVVATQRRQTVVHGDRPVGRPVTLRLHPPSLLDKQPVDVLGNPAPPPQQRDRQKNDEHPPSTRTTHQVQPRAPRPTHPLPSLPTQRSPRRAPNTTEPPTRHEQAGGVTVPTNTGPKKARGGVTNTSLGSLSHLATIVVLTCGGVVVEPCPRPWPSPLFLARSGR